MAVGNVWLYSNDPFFKEIHIWKAGRHIRYNTDLMQVGKREKHNTKVHDTRCYVRFGAIV